MPDKNNDVENDKYVEKSRSGQPRKEKLRGKSDINKNTKYRKKVERIPKQKNQTQNKKLERSKANTDVGDIESEIDTENEEEHMAELSSDNEKSDDKTVKVSRKRGRSKNTETESKISPQKMMKQNKKIPLSSVKNDSQYERPEKSDDDSETDGTYYEVNKIKDVHFRMNGTREFLVSWKGYKSNDDTWEPEAHLNCKDLIEKFMEKVQKAKEISPKELRRMSRRKQIVPVPQARIHCGYRLRNPGFRPFYED
ncbi:probable chromo domain-containing protein LHP1 [Homalodisca vitripennis]|uniref:probable chromo domain-containing protein LHP1 n=1 Tax=Homalodisca vitripennis TaxID=197043 RepID=UPI001EEB7C1D|nr:probable chromo domain-containing protein LHP1 [Homalodisca vitripennis]XP_046663188.1 probable chromo domain-containing protein LHP1 [Homalodisca vitripennis]